MWQAKKWHIIYYRYKRCIFIYIQNKEIKIIENSKSKGQTIINTKKFERQYESLKIAFMNECE